MTTTPKWYCRNKSQPMHTFAEIGKLGLELRRITKRIVIDVNSSIFSEHDTILEECERVVEQYWNLKDETKNADFQSLSKKIKRSPYNQLLMRKFNLLMELNDRRFCQLTFVLKQTLSHLLRKSMQSEMWLNWALHITQLYNKCRKVEQISQLPPVMEPTQRDEEEAVDEPKLSGKRKEEMHANVCSNMYPALLMSIKPIDFGYVLQLVSQTRVEQNALDLVFGLFNMGEQDAWREQQNLESTSSSLEILRTLNISFAAGDYQSYCESAQDYNAMVVTDTSQGQGQGQGQEQQSLRCKHTESFLQKERLFIAQLIAKALEICPTIFDNGKGGPVDMNAYIVRGMRLLWSYVGIILDHILLWWIDTPMSCYNINHIDSIRSWLYHQSVNDIPEPVFSTLRGIGEILTGFVCNNIWDQLFRLTLISSTSSKRLVDQVVEQYRDCPKNEFGTFTGTVWISIFSNLVNLSNQYFSNIEVHNNSSLLPVAEQIPILHRLDHSVHSMRLWVTEQAKFLCCEWKMDRFFQIMEHDVKLCLNVFITFKLPKLTADLSDILMLVCVALRTKLIFEVNANIDKLKKTTDECVQILSAVCRVLSLANFTLCFPAASFWQREVYNNDEKSLYVGYVLDEIFLPTIRATNDIVILKLILKLICEAWLDFIYQKRIRFSVNGAVRLLNDFDDVREWILSCTQLDEQQLDKLSNHEVLRMCKGVGKILLRKPEDIISISQSPKFDKKSQDAAAQDTQLPSEMFVSNQQHWLQLRASGGSGFPFLKLCCGDAIM
ncbi:uncharacterized protein Dwil_GK11629 [Drosophila willistoni]|uniref:Coiled-coil protein 142 C-terminal domain-containing protein n=1 Tax=Drosophila willistoni TaxID=7260 RepID=B4N9Q8_DROWI|nr:uncharacterized protein LOC6647480 [Drosophila willistoni]EDW80623.1 uncharacterized protein Dwil_GK11629 [Drosophila willistoni]